MMVIRFSTLSAPEEKEVRSRRELRRMATVLLLQTQPRPQSPQNPSSTMLFPQFLLPLGDVLTHQLGKQRSHQVCLAKVGSDLNKHIHVFHHQLLQPGHRAIKHEKMRPMVHLPPSLLPLPFFPRGLDLLPGGLLPQYLQLHDLRGHMPHQVFTQELHAIGAQEFSQSPQLWNRVTEVPGGTQRTLVRLHNSYRVT